MTFIKVINVNPVRHQHKVYIVPMSDDYATKKLTTKKERNIFNKAIYNLYLSVSSAEIEMWERNADLRTYPGGLMRQVEHSEWVEQVSSCGYLTWYTTLPNRHQRKHSAAWRLANELDEK